MEQLEQIIYQTKDLKDLSVLSFYTGHIKIPGPAGLYGGKFDSYGRISDGLSNFKIEPLKLGAELPGGLKIKDIKDNTVSFQQDFGGVGNIYTFHPDGHGALRFYGNKIVGDDEKGKDREKKLRSW